jgi:uncharacterized protein with ATP-grasp and redox domains
LRTYPECLVCILRQALTAACLAGADEATQFTVLRRVAPLLEHADSSASPSDLAGFSNAIAREETGVDDPYHESRREGNQLALDLYPRLKELVSQAEDPVDVAIRLSIAGNTIDALHPHDGGLWAVIEDALERPISGGGLTALREALDSARSILYLADNAGETAFDRVLIETLARPVVYAVKSGPILNDATYQDALLAGIDQVARVMETGSRAPGTVLNQCTDEFMRVYESADVIISKGQANYETLSTRDDRIFCLLKVKCPIIARDSGISLGRTVVLRSDGSPKERIQNVRQQA